MTWTDDQQTDLLNIIRRRSERDVLQQQLVHTQTALSQQLTQQQELYDILLREEQDVDRLERFSWTKLYYDLLNRREQQLTKEQAEAERALSRYETTKAYVAELTNRQSELQQKLDAYATIDAEYDELIRQKTGALLVQQGDAIRQYQGHVAALAVVDKRLHELKEAHTAGLQALNQTMQLAELIDEARSLGNWDMFSKSAILSLQKYQKLDRVKLQSERVSWNLQQFKSELMDANLTLDGDWQVADGLTRFVDIFFDNFFTDWSVQRRIEQMQHDATILEDKLVYAIRLLKKEIEGVVADNGEKAARLRKFLERI